MVGWISQAFLGKPIKSKAKGKTADASNDGGDYDDGDDGGDE